MRSSAHERPGVEEVANLKIPTAWGTADCWSLCPGSHRPRRKKTPPNPGCRAWGSQLRVMLKRRALRQRARRRCKARDHPRRRRSASLHCSWLSLLSPVSVNNLIRLERVWKVGGDPNMVVIHRKTCCQRSGLQELQRATEKRKKTKRNWNRSKATPTASELESNANFRQYGKGKGNYQKCFERKRVCPPEGWALHSRMSPCIPQEGTITAHSLPTLSAWLKAW